MVSRTLFANDLLKALAFPGACRKQMLQFRKTHQNCLGRVTPLDDISCIVLHNIIKNPAEIILSFCRRDSLSSHSDFTLKLQEF